MIQTPFHFNCDMGEGSGNDAAIMPYIEFCSIACGGHAGDDESIQETMLLARTHQVRIGAHPSFPDKEHFGRRILEMETAALLDALFVQIERVKCLANVLGMDMFHIKLHGALYNQAMWDAELARHYAHFHKTHFRDYVLFVLPGSELASQAKANGIPVMREGFADRGYAKNGSLLPRSHPNGVLTSPEQVWQHLNHYQTHGTLEGAIAEPVKIDTFCVHGDHTQTPNILRYVIEKEKERE